MSPAYPLHRTYCRPEKWRNICATFQRYYEQQTWFALELDGHDAALSYQFTDAPEIDDHFVCCDGKISSPTILAGIKKKCGDHEHEGLLFVAVNSCIGVPAEEQGKLSLQLTWDEDSDEENNAQEFWHPDDVLIAIWEADAA